MTAAPDPSAPTVPDPSESARLVFGDTLPDAVRFAEMLATDGVQHGHIGPRELPRLWPRHLVNSALLTDLVPLGSQVLDVGSGAGLPGLPMAIRRPDLHVVLLEPMQRRIAFLEAAVTGLNLADRVRVVRGRADDPAVLEALGDQQWIVARAVAPLDRLVRWCVPLLGDRGRLLALKGASAAAEMAAHRALVRKLTGGSATVVSLGSAGSTELTRVVSVQRHRPPRANVRRRR